MKASEIGRGFDLFEAVKWLNPDQQKEFLRTHKIPLTFIPRLLWRYPHLGRTFVEVGREYLWLMKN